MAKASKYEECMICGNLPCTCNGTPKPARTKKPKLDSTPADFHVENTDRDFAMVNALTAIYPLLSPTSQRAAEVQMHPARSSEVDKRLIAFKEGRRDADVS